MLHRDLKPQNVLLDDYQDAKVLACAPTDTRCRVVDKPCYSSGAGVRFWAEQTDRQEQRHDYGGRHRGVSDLMYTLSGHISLNARALIYHPPHLTRVRYMPPEVMGMFREEGPGVDQPKQASIAWHSYF